MRLRTKLFLVILAGLAGFLATRPDLRKRLSEGLEEYKLSVNEAIEEAKQAAGDKEKELTQEVKATQEETTEAQ